jgi:hypothetical protein
MRDSGCWIKKRSPDYPVGAAFQKIKKRVMEKNPVARFKFFF